MAMVQEMKGSWHVATFGTDEAVTRKYESVVDKVLEQFGSKLIELAVPVWSTQKAALEQASFMKSGRDSLEFRGGSRP